MSIAIRIVLLIALAIAGLIGLGGFSLYQMSSINQGVKETNEITIPGILKLGEAQTAFLLARPFLINVLIESDPARRETLIQRFNERIAEMNAALADYEKLAADDKDRELLAHDRKTAAAYGEFSKKYATAALAGNREEATAISRSAADTVNGLSNALVEHAKYVKVHAEESAREAYDIHQTAIRLVVTAIILLSLFVAIIGFLIYRHVAGGLGRMVDIFSHVEKDLDFTTRLSSDGNDEIAKVAHAFNGLLERLQTSFRQITHHAESVNSAAQRVSTAARQMSVASQYQSESASSMAAAVEEMTVSVNHVADRAEDTRRLATNAGTVAGKGEGIISETVLSINSIATTVQSASTQLTDLEKQSEKISSIVSVIKEIADQTNLLALNAAIEAARAGEQGRGFAVVADEVRKLAERTGHSTQEIASTIQQMVAGSQAAVQSIQSVEGAVGAGVAFARQASDAMQEIGSGSADTVGMVSDITSAIREQGVASTDIAQQVEKIAQMTEENSAAAQSTSNTSEELVKLAQEMHQIVARYRV
ncbi:chemotaxis protein [Azonexus hydrophilus]|uniref:Chemotaxis protein n=1 Tax=Azonexus hydrophilus TaxID=418702 RepID=A0A1R1I1P1_9RHOO|nr:methyl-accepting chemotaxis protein [Azonexus hydrophilus]OMG52569.1 chemotaxis protein [Azonexus hydrophilus]